MVASGKKRAPTEYNIYMKNQMKIFKEKNPEMEHRQVFKEVAESWTRQKGLLSENDKPKDIISSENDEPKDIISSENEEPKGAISSEEDEPKDIISSGRQTTRTSKK